MATHFSVLAWEILWTEEPGRLQSMRLQRVGYNLATDTHLLYNVVLVSVVQQCESAVSILYHLPIEPPSHTPPIPPLQDITEYRAELPVLYSSFPRTIYFTYDYIYIHTYIYTHTYQSYSLNSSHPLLPPLCPQVHSLYLCLYSCPANRVISTIFLDSIYMC